MPSPPRIRRSLLLPCFNEEQAIRATLEELERELQHVAQLEIIVIDDGSTDDTSRVLEEFQATEHPVPVQVVRHERNRGYGAALKSGIRQARGRYIAITDADGTYPNHRLPELFERCRGVDMVVGSRTGDNVVYSKIRKIPKLFLRAWVEFLAGQSVPDMNSGLRVFRKSVALRFLKVLPDSFSFTTTITLAMLCNRYRVEFVPIDYAPRIGKSKIRPLRDTLRFTQLILRTGMYFAPLRLLLPAIILFFSLTLASGAYDVFYARNLADKTVLFLMLALTTSLFALLADMIDKRTP